MAKAKTYTVWVVVVETESKRPVDLYPAEVADMESLPQAQLVAKIMAGTSQTYGKASM